MTGPGPSSAAGRRNTPSIRSKATSRCCKRDYWAARNKWPQAIALAGDLVAINPDSPYADRLVFLAAECEEKNGRGDRARAAYQSLLTDYPGSPLVAEARKKLTMLTRKQAGAGGKP